MNDWNIVFFFWDCYTKVGSCQCFELPPTSKFVLLRVWLGWCAQRTRRLYWFRQKVPTSSSSLLLVLLAPKVCSRGYKRAREGKDPKSLVKEASGCWELDCCSAVRSCRALVRIYIGSWWVDRFGIPFMGRPAFPFIGQGKARVIAEENKN